MAVEPKSTLKTHFETGDVPTEQQFENLIDSLAHVDDVPTDADLSAHTSNVSNPHSVTKSQVGLSAVDNTSDANKPVSTAQQAAINAHAASTTNPHSVTKAQVGLANVDNTSDTAKPVSTAQQAAINAHANRVDNPHSVTKTQVGLGNVNNTADTAKPVSTAQQAAIDAHANRTDNPHNVTAAQIGLNATESFNNIADMKAASLTDGQLTHTEGYDSSGDDGGNLYIYHSTGRPGSQDGGFVIFGNGASDWFEAWDTTVANVRKFGAKGDGVTDDITAINNAISAATTQVTFPYGTYNVSAKITVNTQHHITGYGAIITPTVAMDSVMEILADDCTVTGLTLDLDGDAVPVTTERGEGMRIYGNRCTARDIIIRECPVGGFANGFYLALGRGIHLIDCHVYDAGYAAYRCDAPQAMITNCNAIYTRQRTNAKYRWLVTNGPVETFVYDGGQWEFYSGFTSVDGSEGCVCDHETHTSEPNISLQNITIYTPSATWDPVSTTIKVEAVNKCALRNIDGSDVDAPYCFRPSLNWIAMNQCVIEGCHFNGQISVNDPNSNDLRELIIKDSIFNLPAATDLIRNGDRVKLIHLQHVRMEGDWRGIIGPANTAFDTDVRHIIDDVECIYGGSSNRYLFGFAPTTHPSVIIRGLKIDEGAGQVYLTQSGTTRLMFSGDDKTLYYDFPLSMYYRGGTGTCGVAASPPSASNNQIQAAASGDAFPGITGLEPGTRILNMNPANGSPSSWIYNGTSWDAEGSLASVKNYGAVGDGVADDSAAFKLAMDAGRCYVPPGTYLCSTQQSVSADFVMYGEGTIKAGVNSTAFLCSGDATIRDLSFTGTATASRVFQFTGATKNARLENCTFSDWDVTGGSQFISPVNFKSLKSFVVDNCVFRNLTVVGNGTFGDTIGSASGITVEDQIDEGLIQNCVFDVIQTKVGGVPVHEDADGINIDAAGNEEHIVVQNCVFSGCEGRAVKVGGSASSTYEMRGCRISAPAVGTINYKLWETGKSVSIGDYRLGATAGNIYQATTSGTTGGSQPTHPSGNASDGGVNWDFISSATTVRGMQACFSCNTAGKFTIDDCHSTSGAILYFAELGSGGDGISITSCTHSPERRDLVRTTKTRFAIAQSGVDVTAHVNITGCKSINTFHGIATYAKFNQFTGNDLETEGQNTVFFNGGDAIINGNAFTRRAASPETGDQGLLFLDGMNRVSINNNHFDVHRDGINFASADQTDPDFDCIVTGNTFGVGLTNRFLVHANILPPALKIYDNAPDDEKFGADDEEVFNVKQYGAKGDGATDDTAAIQAADVAAAAANGVVYFPSGVYLVTSTTNPTASWLGVGPESVIKIADNASPGSVADVSPIQCNTAGLSFRNFVVDGNRANQSWLPLSSSNYGLSIHANDCSVVNVECRSVTANGMGVPSVATEGVVFINCRGTDNGKKGFHSGDVSGITITGGIWSNNINDAGIGLHQGATDVVIDGVVAENNTLYGIYIGNSLGAGSESRRISVTGCRTSGNGTCGIFFTGQGNTFDLLSMDCTVSSCIVSDGILLQGAADVSLIGNHLTEGIIDIRNAARILVSGNSVLNATETGDCVKVRGLSDVNTTLQHCENIRIDSNRLKTGGDYHIALTNVIDSEVVDNVFLATAGTADVRLWTNRDPGGEAQTVTFSQSGSDLMGTSTAHGFGRARVVQFTTTGTLPTGLSLSTDYYLVQTTADTFELSATKEGSSIAYTDAGSGTHTMTTQDDPCRFRQTGSIRLRATYTNGLETRALVRHKNDPGAPTNDQWSLGATAGNPGDGNKCTAAGLPGTWASWT